MQTKKIEAKKLKLQLGENIKFYREKLGISQEKLSFDAGLHRNYVSDAERGQRNVSLIALAAIAKGLQISISQLVDFEDKK